MKLSYFSISQQGNAHVQWEKPCQDYSGAIDVKNEHLGIEMVVSAIADGVGSCDYSQDGSRIAVTTALEVLGASLAELEEMSDKTVIPEIKKAFQTALERINQDAEETERPFMLYDTTLTVAILTETGMCYFGHIGDDGIVALTADGKYGMITSRIEGEEANSVTPLSAASNWMFGVMQEPVAALVLMTDGLLDKSVAEALDNRIYYPFFQTLFEKVMETEQDVNDLRTYWNDYLSDQEFRTGYGVSDDITLAVVQVPSLLKKTTPVPFDEEKWVQDVRRIKEENEKALAKAAQEAFERNSGKKQTKKPQGNAAESNPPDAGQANTAPGADVPPVNPAPQPAPAGNGAPIPPVNPAPQPAPAGNGAPIPPVNPAPRPAPAGNGAPIPPVNPAPRPAPAGNGAPIPPVNPAPRPAPTGNRTPNPPVNPAPRPAPAGNGAPIPPVNPAPRPAPTGNRAPNPPVIPTSQPAPTGNRAPNPPVRSTPGKKRLQSRQENENRQGILKILLLAVCIIILLIIAYNIGLHNGLRRESGMHQQDLETLQQRLITLEQDNETQQQQLEAQQKQFEEQLAQEYQRGVEAGRREAAKTTEPPAPTATPTVSPEHFTAISSGQRGDRVKEIQEMLRSKGWTELQADGIYGKQTEAAVKEFQKKNHLQATGVVDYQTYQLLASPESVGLNTSNVTNRPTATPSPTAAATTPAPAATTNKPTATDKH